VPFGIDLAGEDLAPRRSTSEECRLRPDDRGLAGVQLVGERTSTVVLKAVTDRNSEGGRRAARSWNRPGDIVYYRFKGTNGKFPPEESFTHAAMITKVTKKGAWVAQHTTDYEKPLADVIHTLLIEKGELGKDWLMQFVRPTGTAYNVVE
jgi:hypothetical protein